jgi:outer membrane lipoprotein
MSINHARSIFFVFLVIVLAGCASGLSQRSLAKVTYTGTFKALQENPNRFVDEIALFGGKILEANTAPASSELMVLQMPLDNNNRPDNPDQSTGRFLVRTKQFLDPAIYQKGGLLSTVGVVKGGQARAIGGLNYVYPLLEAVEIKLWPANEGGYPRIHFGIGVGTSF